MLAGHGLTLGEEPSDAADACERSAAADAISSDRPGFDITLQEAGLSTRALNALRRLGLRSLGDVAALQRAELEAVPTVGLRTLDDIEQALAMYGLALADTLPAAPAGEGYAHGPPLDPRTADACERPAAADALGSDRPGVDITLEETGLSTRSFNVLRRLGLRSLGDVAALRRAELAGVSTVGLGTLDDIEEALAMYGLALADTPPAAAPAGEGYAHRPRVNARTAAMISLREAGATIREIAEVHRLSYQRVQQILKAAGIDGRAARESRSVQDRADAEARHDDILQAFRRGDAPARTARILQLNESAVRGLLRTTLTPGDRAVRRGNRRRRIEPRYSDEDLVAAVREVGQRYGRAPTSGEYAQAAAGGMLPSVPTIVTASAGDARWSAPASMQESR